MQLLTHTSNVIRTHNFEPNIELDVDVCVDSIQLLTHTSKSISTVGTFSGMCPRRSFLNANCLLCLKQS